MTTARELEDHKLVGIIAQADTARSLSPVETGETVGAISAEAMLPRNESVGPAS